MTEYVSTPLPSSRPLKVGLFLPTGEVMHGGATAHWPHLLALARRAEELGFDSLWVPDHVLLVLGSSDDATQGGAWECWSILSAIAAVTTRVELGPLVSCAAYRNPALLAKMADMIDNISGGRLILGLGAGWAESEFNAFGFPFDHWVDRFEEAFRSSPGCCTVDVWTSRAPIPPYRMRYSSRPAHALRDHRSWWAQIARGCSS